MEDIVYTLPAEARFETYAANTERLREQDIDPEATPMWIKNKHLPLVDKSSGVVRFRSVTPKQRFVKGPDQSTNDVMDEIQEAAWRHRELAADHIAAALWIKTEAPVLKAPVTRVTKEKTARVTLPLDHEHVNPSDFQHALRVAGTQEGEHPHSPIYLGRTGNTGDGRTQHIFEVTYTWTEVEK